MWTEWINVDKNLYSRERGRRDEISIGICFVR